MSFYLSRFIASFLTISSVRFPYILFKNGVNTRFWINDINKSIGKNMNEPNFEKAKADNSYANPTIAESICEIHFERDSSQSQSYENILRLLKNELFSDYPSVTEQEIKQFHAAISHMGISVSEEKLNTPRLIFKHRERDHVIQFLPNILTINEVKNYPGWDFFLNDIFRGWTALNSKFPAMIKRVGLRYINLVPRRNSLEPLSAWFKPNIYYPNEILNSSRSFLARNEFDLKKNIRLIVTLSESIQEETKGSIIFDIDAIISFEEKIINWDILKKNLEDLHSIVWEVFSTSFSEKYEALLKGELL